MTIKVVCKCGQKFSAREELAGRAIECTACGAKIHVPMAGPSVGLAGATKALLSTLLTVLVLATIAGGAALYKVNQRVHELGGGLAENKTADAKAIADAELRANRLDNDIKQAQSALTTARTARAGLQSDLKQLNNDLFNARISLAMTQQQLTTTQAMAGKNEAAIQALDVKLDAEETKVAKLETDRDSVVKKLAAAEAQVGKLEKDCRLLDAQAKSAATGLRTAETARSLLDTKIKSVESNVGTLESTVGQVSAAVDTIRPADAFQVLESDSALAKLDTRNGEALVYEPFAFRGRGGFVPADIREHYASPLPKVGDARPGTYEAAFSRDAFGAARWIVRLDRVNGRVWYCDLRVPSRVRAWNDYFRPRYPGRRPSRHVAFSTPSPDGLWSLEMSGVSAPRGQVVPEIVLTAPDGTSYASVTPYYPLLAPVW